MVVRRVAQPVSADASTVETLASTVRSKRRGPLSKVLRSRNLVIGGTILGLIVLGALLAPWITSYGPLEQNPGNALQSPSLDHPFGTDNFGRDIFSRVLHGGRIDLRFGVLAVLAPLLIGIVIGSVAAYYGRWVDALLMRMVDIVQAFPFIVLVIFFVAVLGPGLWNMVMAVAIVAWIVYARLIRGSILVEKNKEYVIAAKAIGGGDWRIMRQHLFPNVVTPSIIYSMADIAQYIGLLATLSFLGLGERPPAPEWGAMISSGRDYMVTAWWICAIPGAAIVITGIALSMIGDGLADVLRPSGR